MDGGRRLSSRRAAGVLVSLFWAAPLPARAADLSGDALTAMASALAFGAVCLALAAGLWALAERRDARRLRRVLRQSETRTRAAMGARDALIGAGREAVIVWGRDGASPRIRTSTTVRQGA